MKSKSQLLPAKAPAASKAKKVQRSQRKINITTEAVNYGTPIPPMAWTTRRAFGPSLSVVRPVSQHSRTANRVYPAHSGGPSAPTPALASSSSASLSYSLASREADFSGGGVPIAAAPPTLTHSPIPWNRSVYFYVQGRLVRSRRLNIPSLASRRRHRDRLVEHEKYQGSKKNMRHRFPLSPFFPKCFKDWVALRKSILDESLEKKKVDVLEKENKAPKAGHLFGGKAFLDGRSAVLSPETIWNVWGAPWWKVEAPWPSFAEQVWEGDTRSKSSYKRFLPIPRMPPPNETIVWHTLEAAHILEFDKMDAVQPWGKGVQEIGDAEGEGLLGESLWACL